MLKKCIGVNGSNFNLLGLPDIYDVDMMSTKSTLSKKKERMHFLMFIVTSGMQNFL